MYCVSWRIAARSARQVQPPRSSRAASRVAAATSRIAGSIAARTRRPRALPERDQAHRGRNQIRREGLQIAERGIVLGNAVPRRQHADRDRIGGPLGQSRCRPRRGGGGKRSPDVERFGAAFARSARERPRVRQSPPAGPARKRRDRLGGAGSRHSARCRGAKGRSSQASRVSGSATSPAATAHSSPCE